MFEGTYTAVVTPFADGEVDFEALGKLVDAQLEAGIDGLVPCGSTGESATLTHTEHEKVIAFVVERVAGRAKVIAGTGSNSTRESVRLTKFAAEEGADGALLIAPYYNKPTQEGLYAHHAAIAEACDLPLLAYNIPGRSAVNIAPQTVARLSEIPSLVGIKEASGSMDQICQTIALCGPDFTVLAGDDAMTLPIMAVGGKGVISVISNVLPQRFKALVQAMAVGDLEGARAIHYELLPTMGALFLETNPIPVKTALHLLGQIGDEIRLPLTPMSEGARQRLASELKRAGLMG